MHFDCPQLPPLTNPAKTVYELRPQDIKVIMAIGDSVTAGIKLPSACTSVSSRKIYIWRRSSHPTPLHVAVAIDMCM